MPTFVNLPREVQHIILNEVSSDIADILQCVLVCKSWKSLFQKPLYNNVQLKNYLQTAKLLNTLDENEYLSSLIMKLAFAFENEVKNREHNSTIARLFAHLQNLVSVDCLRGEYIAILLDALLLNRLPNLNKIQPGGLRSEMHDYNSCAILLKDRLTNLIIAEKLDINQTDESEARPAYDEDGYRIVYDSDSSEDDYSYYNYSEEEPVRAEFPRNESNQNRHYENEVNEDMYYNNDFEYLSSGEDYHSVINNSNTMERETVADDDKIESAIYSDEIYRIFSNLDKFKNIKELTIEKKPENIIQLIEKVTQSCPFLQRLEIEFITDDDRVDVVRNDKSFSIISSSLPACNITHLTLHKTAYNDPQLINYVIHKLPRLEKLEFPKTNHYFDEATFSKILNYMSKIKSIFVPNISTKEKKSLIDSIDEFWNISSESHVLSVEKNYDAVHNQDEMEVLIETAPNHNKNDRNGYRDLITIKATIRS